MLYIISKKSVSRPELNNIKNIRAKSSKKRRDDSSNSSSDKWESYSSLSSDEDWDKHRQPLGHKEINGLDHVVIDNINTNKCQLNDTIYNDTAFDNNSFNLSICNRDPLPVVTVTLLVSKKHRATTVDGITCVWDSGATDNMIKIKHTKYYECKMRYNKVEYSTANGVYCTTHDFKVHFLWQSFLAAR